MIKRLLKKHWGNEKCNRGYELSLETFNPYNDGEKVAAIQVKP